MTIAAVVIWYNPKPEFVDNVRTYAGHVDNTIIMDNSDTDNSALAGGLANTEYIPLRDNRGIAAALNIGVRRAAELGADWALTMDQDSWFESDDITRFLDPEAAHFAVENAAILSPTTYDAARGSETVECLRTITSGSLTNIALFDSAGGFNDDMFIDSVDHEYCYRMTRAGAKILQVNSVFLHHQLGTPLTKRLFGRKMTSPNHSPLRKHYIIRNLLYIRGHFPEHRQHVRCAITNEILATLAIEDQKILKIYRMARGVWDYWTGRMGKIG